MSKPTDNHQDDQSRAQELLSRYFESTLNATESLELIAIWDRAEQLGNDAVLEGQIESALRYFGVARQESYYHAEPKMPLEPDLDELVRLVAESPALPMRRTIETSVAKTKSTQRSKIDKKESFALLKWLIFPCLLLFVLVVYREFWPKTSFDTDPFVTVARIVESVEAKWEEGSEEYKVGRELEPCSLKLKSGVVKIEFGSGVEVVLEGPTELLVKGRNMAFCQRGKLSADVPPRGIGFQVATPTATVVDLGTRFSMQVDEGKTDVHVMKGKVEVNQTANGVLQLIEGLAGSFPLDSKMKTIPVDPETFFSAPKLKERKDRYVAGRQAVWEEQSLRQDSDPSLLYHLNPERQKSLSRTVGSREGRSAVCFHTQHDSIEISLPGAYDNLTLIATVRLSNMGNHTNTLCLGLGFFDTDGEFFWQLGNNGILRFHLFHGMAQRYDSVPIVKRSDCRTWMQIALVADAKGREIRHYVDGRRVATLPWENPIPLKMAEGTIGNTPKEQRRYAPRFWNGDMDSFHIFSRVFTDVEIAMMYKNMQ